MRVHAMQIGSLDNLAGRTFPGRAKAGEEVNQSFRVAGPLIEFPVKVGDKVKAGQPVAVMDPADYRNALLTLEGQLAREQARLTRAQADLKRLRRAYRQDSGAVSQVAIDRALQVRDSSAANLRSLRASVDDARNQLSYTELKAPFDGVVVETYVENFETVRPKQPILRILNTSRIEFIIHVPENLIGYTPYVRQVTVVFDAFPSVTVAASISEIGKEASQATRTFPVTLVMAQPPGIEILAGMAGRATVLAEPPEGAVSLGAEVPATAVFAGDELAKTYVWVVELPAALLRRREVSVAGLSEFGTRVQSGLQAGEWIVTKGVHSLQEGQRVEIIEAVGESS